MILVEIKSKFYNIPTTWNELTREQLLDIVDTVYLKKYQPEQTLIKLMKILLGFSFRKFFSLKAEQIEDKLYLVSFLFQDTASLTKQLMPIERNLHGPADDISNMLMGEFVFSEHFFMQWQDNKTDISLLDHFVATIYRPAKKNYDFEKNPDGDPRVQFNENICAWYANKIIKGWPQKLKLAIATWYAGCRQKLVDDNLDVFGDGGEPAMHGLISIMRVVAKDNTYGDFDKLEMLPVSTMMMELKETVAEGKRKDAQIKAQG